VTPLSLTIITKIMMTKMPIMTMMPIMTKMLIMTKMPIMTMMPIMTKMLIMTMMVKTMTMVTLSLLNLCGEKQLPISLLAYVLMSTVPSAAKAGMTTLRMPNNIAARTKQSSCTEISAGKTS
jgi:hypothetical protein